MELQKILGKFFENCCQQPLKKNDLGYMQGNLKFLINGESIYFPDLDLSLPKIMLNERNNSNNSNNGNMENLYKSKNLIKKDDFKKVNQNHRNERFMEDEESQDSDYSNNIESNKRSIHDLKSSQSIKKDSKSDSKNNESKNNELKNNESKNNDMRNNGMKKMNVKDKEIDNSRKKVNNDELNMKNNNKKHENSKKINLKTRKVSPRKHKLLNDSFEDSKSSKNLLNDSQENEENFLDSQDSKNNSHIIDNFEDEDQDSLDSSQMGDRYHEKKKIRTEPIIIEVKAKVWTKDELKVFHDWKCGENKTNKTCFSTVSIEQCETLIKSFKPYGNKIPLYYRARNWLSKPGDELIQQWAEPILKNGKISVVFHINKQKFTNATQAAKHLGILSGSGDKDKIQAYSLFKVYVDGQFVALQEILPWEFRLKSRFSIENTRAKKVDKVEIDADDEEILEETHENVEDHPITTTITPQTVAANNTNSVKQNQIEQNHHQQQITSSTQNTAISSNPIEESDMDSIFIK